MITQYGVLAYEIGQDGEPRFLLITSRTTRRWIIPRGNPIRGLSSWQSAAQEAYEEAGLTGYVGLHEIGSYSYLKRRSNGSSDPAIVHVFPLSTPLQSRDWPERHQRETRWFKRAEAAEAVEEEDLKALIRAFSPPPPDGAGTPPGSWFAPIRAPLWARPLRWLRRRFSRTVGRAIDSRGEPDPELAVDNGSPVQDSAKVEEAGLPRRNQSN